jgi:hypothetical protein
VHKVNLVSLSTWRPQKTFLPIKLEVPATRPAHRLSNLRAISQNLKQCHASADEHKNTEVWVVRSEIADLEEDILECADGRFRTELRGGSDDSREGF